MGRMRDLACGFDGHSEVVNVLVSRNIDHENFVMSISQDPADNGEGQTLWLFVVGVEELTRGRIPRRSFQVRDNL